MRNYQEMDNRKDSCVKGEELHPLGEIRWHRVEFTSLYGRFFMLIYKKGGIVI